MKIFLIEMSVLTQGRSSHGNYRKIWKCSRWKARKVSKEDLKIEHIVHLHLQRLVEHGEELNLTKTCNRRPLCNSSFFHRSRSDGKQNEFNMKQRAQSSVDPHDGVSPLALVAQRAALHLISSWIVHVAVDRVNDGKKNWYRCYLVKIDFLMVP